MRKFWPQARIGAGATSYRLTLAIWRHALLFRGAGRACTARAPLSSGMAPGGARAFLESGILVRRSASDVDHRAPDLADCAAGWWPRSGSAPSRIVASVARMLRPLLTLASDPGVKLIVRRRVSLRRSVCRPAAVTRLAR